MCVRAYRVLGYWNDTLELRLEQKLKLYRQHGINHIDEGDT